MARHGRLEVPMAILAVTSVSIIIPTQGTRQNLLLRAVRSARLPGDSVSVEVILVVNGNNAADFSLPDELMRLRHAQLFDIKVIRTETANVSLARNMGIVAAKGNMIRFLDDDDFLIPEIAHQQCMELWISNADRSEEHTSEIQSLMRISYA